MYYIGLDLGTSGLKGLLVEKSGKILREESASYPVLTPKDGWSEQNPEDWLAAAKSVLARLSKGVESKIRGLSVGGQMHGLVALDSCDRVIRPCILWNDGRTEKQVEYLNCTVGKEKLVKYTANVAFAGFTAPKILWLKENEPKNFSRISKIMLPKDYLIFMLTGVFCTDFSDAAGTLLLDVEKGIWSEEMCRICGICAGQLPALYKSSQAVGTVKEEIAKAFGWGKVVVAAGAADNAAAALGCGAVSSGDCNISLGTSGTLFIVNDKFALPQNNALHSFCHTGGKYCLMGCILSAASANKWWTEDILGANYGIADSESGLLGKNEVYFLPYLSGERCPHNDVNARAAFIGLSLNTTKAQMSLAVLEGVSFALRDCLEIAKSCGMRVKESTVCGGGAKSRIWLKILSNVLNMEIKTVETEQGPAYGAAILAMVACGEYGSEEQAVAATVAKTTVEKPVPELVSLYNERYAKYRQLYPRLYK